MATKEKWIDLFEKAVGRPPHALEIEEGQKADFDLNRNNHHFFTDLFRDRNGTRIWSFPDCKSERHPCE